ncbi:MAG TPA: hypothetical protein DEO26_03500 [Candidatus Veblenbacteria bacterium]|nr:hypothetical protein [Candidatus Veblenbacteria bacterium]
MLITRDDLKYLEIHAGITMDYDDYFCWKCLYTGVVIKFASRIILVDYSLFKKMVEIVRPFCPSCTPDTEKRNQFTELISPYPYVELVDVIES